MTASAPATLFIVLTSVAVTSALEPPESRRVALIWTPSAIHARVRRPRMLMLTEPAIAKSPVPAEPEIATFVKLNVEARDRDRDRDREDVEHRRPP